MAVICKLPHKNNQADGIQCRDTYSLGSGNLQGLIDIIADRVANRLLAGQDVVDHLISETKELPLSARQGNVLSKRDTVLTMPRIIGQTEEEINNIYNNFSTDMQNLTWYRRLLDHGVYHSVLGGGTFYLEGFKLTSEYEWQRATTYNRETAMFFRTKERGSWSEWEQLMTKSAFSKYHIFSTLGKTKMKLTFPGLSDYDILSIKLSGGNSSLETIEVNVVSRMNAIKCVSSGSANISAEFKKEGGNIVILFSFGHGFSSGYFACTKERVFLNPIIEYEQ